MSTLQAMVLNGMIARTPSLVILVPLLWMTSMSWTIIIATLLSIAAMPVNAAGLRCDSPGVAQAIILDMMSKNPSALKLGIRATGVTVLNVKGNACLVQVTTNKGPLKYRFRFVDGKAWLDMVDDAKQLAQIVHADEVEATVAAIAYYGLTDPQIDAVKMTAMASVAGDGKSCPRYRIIGSQFAAELSEAGITPKMVAAENFKTALAYSFKGPQEALANNPSDFCLAAWQLSGPNGLYRRKMLEEAN